MSLFIVEREGKRRVALRTEGVYRYQGCVTYELIDRVDESSGDYMSSDIANAYSLEPLGHVDVTTRIDLVIP